MTPTSPKAEAEEYAMKKYGKFPRPLKDRLIDKRVIDTNGCWNWTGATNDGYGMMIIGSRWMGTREVERVHRLSYTLFNGPIPDGKYALHKCDNRRCFNPDHLYLGDHAQNMADKVARGRQSPHRGEDNPRAKLSARQVFEIREAYATGEFSFVKLGKAYGVGPSTIGGIVAGRLWPLPLSPTEQP